MPPILLWFAVAVPPAPPIGQAITDAELAVSIAGPARPSSIQSVPARAYLATTPALADQVDHWWATDGVALLAAARPIAPAPTGLDLAALRTDDLSIRFTATATATR